MTARISHPTKSGPHGSSSIHIVKKLSWYVHRCHFETLRKKKGLNLKNADYNGKTKMERRF